MPRKPIGERPMTDAERQARCRAVRASGTPAVGIRRPLDHRSRAKRWRDAVSELIALQGQYTASIGAPACIVATVIVSAFDNRSGPIVINRANVRADGVRLIAHASTLSALRRRAAHSLTTRRHPRKPCCLSRRHSSAPF